MQIRRRWFCFVAMLLVLVFSSPAQALEDPTRGYDSGERAVFLKFSARGSTPDQALNRAFAKAGIHWDRMMHPEANKEVSFSVMALPEPQINIMIIPAPEYLPVFQAWVVVRYRVWIER